ncbi:hypothetical protein BGZ60DRAFT_532372 [Tricladium varicosporioides]|nr:hypothetical protein BGZ60DRAFT_532372 [Hymenoscyphus varicosporioides]
MSVNSSTESLGLLLPKDQNLWPTTFEIPPRSNLKDRRTRRGEANNGEIKITAESTPQWLWSTYQCRNWLGCVLTQYLGYTNDEASERVIKLGGFGPNLYLRTYKEWVELLEDEQVARGVYALLVARRYEEGGVPMGMKIGHGEEDTEKRSVRNEGRNWMSWILRKKVRYG